MDFPYEERRARVLLNLHPKMGPVRFGKLLDRFGSAAAALAAAESDWEGLEDWPGAPLVRGELPGLLPLLAKEEARVEALGARVLCALDEEFPEPLRNLRDAPIVLYVRGAFAARDAYAVAVVGSRQMTPYGRAAAERLGKELARAGVTVVSGLARGIDGAAHGAALGAGGRSIGFLGSGLDHFYPRENRALAERMAASGAVATEFPVSAEPDAVHFPRRNRLIAGLALGVVVVEAKEKSGALLTAALAAHQGKDVFAVPGSIFSELSRGPHLLIKQGAKPVESVDDLLEEITVFQRLIARRLAPSEEAPPADLSADGRKILAALSWEPRGVDALSLGTGLAAARLAPELLALELAGYTREMPGKRFVRTERAPTMTSKDGL